MIQAIVGAGGKTTLMHRLARQYREQGLKVLLTTTTHMFIEPDTLCTGSAEEIRRALETVGYAMAGVADGEKIGPLPEAVYLEVCQYADMVLVEADGSRQLPVKYPAPHEPVIPVNADEIIIVCGLQALGRPLREAAHRWELAQACLDIDPDAPLTPAHIQRLVRQGYVQPLKRRYPDKAMRIHPTHDGSLYQRALAGVMAADMDADLIHREWFEPQPELFICGGGHVSCALVQMASLLDFRVRVMDDREEFANRERFPDAHEVICAGFDQLDKYLHPNACCVVVTRGHRDDLLCVQTILRQPFRYLGMIGSRMKVEKAFENLRNAGATQAQLDAIHAPIGLRIGAVTPAEIAVSILAEIIQEKNRTHIASASRELLELQQHGMLCIIIEKTGSSPRGVGSMMFVGRDVTIGSIGGGAVEFAAIEDARSHPQAAIRQYHLNNRDSARLGMICGGSNKVLFVPV